LPFFTFKFKFEFVVKVFNLATWKLQGR
jgi:hypothetical protein